MSGGDGSIEIKLFKRTSKDDNPDYHVGDFGDAQCDIDLRDYTVFCFVNKQNPNDRTLILRPKKKDE
jgi:hypothetical protein